MAKSCFDCMIFPNCKILNGMYSEDDSDEERMELLVKRGDTCEEFKYR